LQLRNKTPKRRVKAKLREDRVEASGPNETWAMDFVHDQLATGRKLRILTVVDTYSRYAPAIDPHFSYRGEDVVRTLEAVCGKIGYPKAIRVDQGSEFISRDLDLWAYHRGVVLDFSRPGKPTDNAFIESFNGKFRAECLNAHWFMNLDDARRKMEEWRRDYNEVRPHSAIGYKPDHIANRLRRAITAMSHNPGNYPAGWSNEGERLTPPESITSGWTNSMGVGQPAEFLCINVHSALIIFALSSPNRHMP
jgi:putative transposase